MTLSEALSKIHAPKGVTTIIVGLMSGDTTPLRNQSAVGKSLADAREQLRLSQQAQNNCTSDWAYWGYQGDVSYWSAVVSILEAAEIAGADSLPDVSPPRDGLVLMDACYEVQQFGKRLLDAAKAAKCETELPF